MRTLSNSEDPDEMSHNAAFRKGLRCMQRGNDLRRNERNVLWKL